MCKMDAKPNGTPFVSIVIPTYNRARFLGRSVRSVLNQTYKNFEVIVVDDASTDDTAEIIKTFKDDRIRYIRHDANAGGAAARNTGIKASRGNMSPSRTAMTSGCPKNSRNRWPFSRT